MRADVLDQQGMFALDITVGVALGTAIGLNVDQR